MMQNLISFKILVLGSQGVGKSSLVIRYLKGQFDESYNVTVGVEFASKVILVEPDVRVRLQIWDTAGQESFRALVRSFYQGISAVFLVYAIDNAQSFRQLKKWAEQVRENSHPEVVLFLIGSKSDCEENRQIDFETASKLLKDIEGALLAETSAKTGQNTQLLFKKAADYMYKKYTANKSFKNLVQPEKDSKIVYSPTKGKGGSILLNKQSFLEQTKNTNKKSCCK